MMDVVYVLRRDEANAALRISLRSVAAHADARRIWAAGCPPAWLAPVVGRILVPARGSTRARYLRSVANLVAAARHPGVSEYFWHFHDDFVLLADLDEPVAVHAGPLAEVAAWVRTQDRATQASAYNQATLAAGAFLATHGVHQPLWYDLHRPMPMMCEAVLAVHDMLTASLRTDLFPVFRTIYGNLWRIGGIPGTDVKIHGSGTPIPPGAAMVSTQPDSFAGRAGALLRARFAQPCRYEAAWSLV